MNLKVDSKDRVAHPKMSDYQLLVDIVTTDEHF